MHKDFVDAAIRDFGEEYVAAGRLFNEMGRLQRVWGLFKPHSHMRRSELGLLGLITHLSEGGTKPVNVGQLAHITRQSKPGITQKVNVLEREGYLRRVAGEDDRRMVQVELTEKGEEANQDFLRGFLGRLTAALERLGQEKTDTLIELMAELSAALDETQTGDRPKKEANEP